MDRQPMVTVVLPCYNHEAFVRESIESVLDQTYENIDLVILENGSTDGSAEIIREYEDRARVIYFEENDINEGRKAFRKATQGEYFAIMTSDDLWEREKIQRQIDFLADHPEYDACFTWADLFDQETGKSVEDVTEAFRAENRSRGEWIRYFWTVGNCLCCPSVVMKSEVYFKIWERDVSHWQHYDFVGWLRMLYFGYSFYVMPEVLVHMRKHSASITYGEQNGAGKRMRNERQSIKIEMLESLTDEQFAEAFRPNFYYGKAASHIEFLCEKILLLLKEGVNNQDIQPLALDFFYRHYQEPGVQEALKETYGFPREYFNRVCSQMGVMDISYKSYQKGAEDAKREFLSEGCSVKFDKVFRQMAGPFIQNISQYMDMIRESGMAEFQAQDELMKGILEFLRLVERSRNALPLFFRSFPEKEWRDFRNLCRKGRDVQAVDLLTELIRIKSYFECILALQEEDE